MASSMLSSERRWTSTRKSGMTVLGKVPKPINLPSQKLENHGLDPNVEIVPKGALTWGARPLLATSNAWGSSTLSSPRADGSSGSILANGRPSSGGSGTRPSTGSSERSSEPSAVSWGPSSRPSSASGILPTSHVLVPANRPRSAETRPNSSQLSRFAESSADGIAWGAAGTSEKVAAEESKRRDFTLSSGDFPTLGSEKIDEPKLQGRSPKFHASESALPSSLKRIPESQLSSGYVNPGPMVHGNFNSWSADSCSHSGEDASIRTENWHKDNHHRQPLLDANMPAPQFATWHGPPGHSPNVVWYGGPEAGGPYRPFGPQGSYHVDPYYPYVPAGAIPNAQAFSRPEAIPDGVHFNKREALRHMPPESYIAHSQSGISVRPGVYQSQVIYEGFHGPPREGFGNSSEQDVSTMGIAGQYAFHNQHLPDNSRLQPWKFHTQPDAAPVMAQQKNISDQANVTHGQYKVLLKQHGNQEEKHAVTTQRGKPPSFSTPEVDLDKSYKQEQTTYKHQTEDSCSEHSDIVDHNNRNSLGISESTGHNVMKKLDTEAFSIRDQHNANLKKSASLMEKVEELNSKTRVVDVHFEAENFPSEKMKNNQSSKNNADHFENIGPTDFNFAGSTPISDSRDLGTSQLNTSTKLILQDSVIELKPSPHQSNELDVLPDNSNDSEYVGHSKSRNQKRIRNIKTGVDHDYGKLKFGSYGADEMNGTPERDPSEKTSMAAGKRGPLLSILGSHASQEVSVSQSPLESVDDVQHAKLKELAKQRAIELQNKELERIAEQKAKAQAKLDELNRRTSASSKQNSRHAEPPCNDVPNKHETTSDKNAKSSAIVNEIPHGSLSCDFQAKSKENDEIVGDLAVSSFTEPSRIFGSSGQACPSVGDQSWPLGQEITTEINTGRTTPDMRDEVASRRKQAGYRRRRNITDEHSQPEGKINSDSSGNTTSASNIIEDSSDGLGNLNRESTCHPSNKNNRGSKYKSKLCDTHLTSPSPSSTPLGGASEKYVVDQNKTKPQVKFVEEQMKVKNSDGTMEIQDSFDLIVAPNQEGSELCKVTSDRTNNKWKPHPHRKPTRNLQSDKANAKYQASDTAIWAPVRQVNKNGSSEQLHNSSLSQVTNLPDGKNCQDMHNGAKARRAEIERYVPKPIAKELSLQGDSQHFSPPLAPVSSANITGKPDSPSASAVSGRDVNSVAKTAMTSTNTEDTKQNRQGKTRASWRQRNSFEHEQSAMDGNLSFETSKCVEKASELQQSRSSDDMHVEGGNGVLEETLMTTLSVVKNHGISRPRRQQYKEHSIDRSSYAPSHSKELQGEISDKREIQSLGPSESGERNHSRNENQSAGSVQMRSHWQPKSQVHPQNCQHGYKNSGGQKATDKLLPSQNKDKNLDDKDPQDQGKKYEVDYAKYQEGYSGKKSMTDDGKHQDLTKGKKLMKQPLKDEITSIDRDLTSITGAASADANSYQDYPGAHRRGYDRGHVARGGYSTYRGSQKARSSGDGRNVEQNIEYQSGFGNKGSDMFQQNSSASEVADAHRVSSGARYGINGRNHSRRGGNLYGPHH